MASLPPQNVGYVPPTPPPFLRQRPRASLSSHQTPAMAETSTSAVLRVLTDIKGIAQTLQAHLMDAMALEIKMY